MPMKNFIKPANVTLARAAQISANFANPTAAVKARLAQIAERHNLKTGAQMLAERIERAEPMADESAEIAPPEVFFDSEENDVPATLETVENEARAYEYQIEVAEAKTERRALLIQKTEVSRRRLLAVRAGGVKAAERLTAEFWAIWKRLEELAEILIWEADAEETEVAPVARPKMNHWQEILNDSHYGMSDFARAKIERLAAEFAA
jgi:hypothetical protein